MKCVLCLQLVALVLASSVNSIFTKNVMPAFKERSNLVEHIAMGAQVGMNSCKEMFKWHRWNCPETAFHRKYEQAASKEMAFAKAIVAAAVVHTITKNCSLGIIEGCGCDTDYESFNENYATGEGLNMTGLEQKTKVDWTWGGCSDNPEYGMQAAKNFLDDLDDDGGVKGLINLHNNQVGRMIVKSTMEKKCRCHGVSGSCTIQTCWMQVAPFSVVAETLKKKYHFASKIVIEPEVANSALEEIKLPRTNPNSLIFLQKSPDYCQTDNTYGWKGTKGRICSKDKNATEYEEKMSCRNLCRTCGHRVRKRRREEKKNCNCSFVWCCKVKCDVCIETHEEFYCH